MGKEMTPKEIGGENRDQDGIAESLPAAGGTPTPLTLWHVWTT